MDHAAGVGIRHRLAHLEEDPQHARLIVGQIEPCGQEVRQGAALDQLHDEIRAAVGKRAQVVDRHDAGVLQLAGDLCLLDEASDQAGVVAMLLEQDLHGQVAADVAVAPLRMAPMPPRAISPRSWSRAAGSAGRGISGEPG